MPAIFCSSKRFARCKEMPVSKFLKKNYSIFSELKQHMQQFSIIFRYQLGALLAEKPKIEIIKQSQCMFWRNVKAFYQKIKNFWHYSKMFFTSRSRQLGRDSHTNKACVSEHGLPSISAIPPDYLLSMITLYKASVKGSRERIDIKTFG